MPDTLLVGLRNARQMRRIRPRGEQSGLPVIMQLHGPRVNVGLQIIVVIRQGRNLVDWSSATPDSLQLQQKAQLSTTS